MTSAKDRMRSSLRNERPRTVHDALIPHIQTNEADVNAPTGITPEGFSPTDTDHPEAAAAGTASGSSATSNTELGSSTGNNPATESGSSPRAQTSPGINTGPDRDSSNRVDPPIGSGPLSNRSSTIGSSLDVNSTTDLGSASETEPKSGSPSHSASNTNADNRSGSRANVDLDSDPYSGFQSGSPRLPKARQTASPRRAPQHAETAATQVTEPVSNADRVTPTTRLAKKHSVPPHLDRPEPTSSHSTPPSGDLLALSAHAYLEKALKASMENLFTVQNGRLVKLRKTDTYTHTTLYLNRELEARLASYLGEGDLDKSSFINVAIAYLLDHLENRSRPS